MLTEKCRNQEEIITDLELREQEHQELEAESELLQQQIQATRWWLFPHLRGFWENVQQFIPQQRFLSFF